MSLACEEARLLLRFFQLMCENHHAEAQTYLQKQAATRSVDIVSSVASALRELKRYDDAERAALQVRSEARASALSCAAKAAAFACAKGTNSSRMPAMAASVSSGGRAAAAWAGRRPGTAGHLGELATPCGGACGRSGRELGTAPSLRGGAITGGVPPLRRVGLVMDVSPL